MHLPQSLNLINQASGVAGHWAASAYLPELLRLEERIFHGLTEHLWDKVGHQRQACVGRGLLEPACCTVAMHGFPAWWCC